MVLKTLKSEKHASKLVSAISSLYDNPDEYSDVAIHVGQSTFRCHKLILTLQSPYLKQRLFPRTQQAVLEYTLDNVVPDDFQNVLRYLYTGEIEFDSRTVSRTLRAVALVQLDDLRRMCATFMEDSLDIKTCVQYWQVAQEVGVSSLGQTCLDFFLKNFVGVT